MQKKIMPLSQSFKYLSYISALIPAVMSYVINLFAASVFSVKDYTTYLYLISVASFLGALAGGGFVDLAVSTTEVTLAEHEKNFRRSVYMTLFSSVAIYFLLPVSLVDGEAKFVLICFVLSLSLTRNYHLYLANNSFTSALLVSRAIRGCCLLLAPGVFYIATSMNVFPNYTMLIAFQCLGLAAGLIWSKELFNAAVYFFRVDTSYFISRKDILKLFKRTLSLSVDLVHMPICLYCLKSASEIDGIGKVEALLFGLSIPGVVIFTQIVIERLRSQYASESVVNLLRFVRQFKVGWLLVSLLISAAISLLAALIFSLNFWFLLLLALFLVNKLASSVSGLVVYKAGLELFDLSVNIVVTLLMIVLIVVRGAEEVFLLIFLLLVGKYMITNIYLYIYSGLNT